MNTTTQFHTKQCTKASTGLPPMTLREATTARVIGRTIIEASPYCGSYGMGGPGFFGLQLKKTRKYPEESLQLTLWAASNWLLVNGRPLAASTDKHKPHIIEKGTFSSIGEQFVKLFVGYKITAFDLTKESFKMTLKRKGKKTLILELPANLSKVPPHGNNEPRTWRAADDMIDGFILSDDEYINI